MVLMAAKQIRESRVKSSDASVYKMHRVSHTLHSILSKRQFVFASPQFNSRLDLIPRSLHISRTLESNFRRSNGTGLVCLEKRPDDRTKTPNNDEFSSDVEKTYRILRKFHSRVPKLELALNESGVELRPGLIERVLNRCGDAGNLGYRFFVWAAKRPGYYCRSHQVYKSMVKILSKMRQFGAVWSLIEEMRKENPQLIEPELFVVLVKRFEASDIVKKAVEVLDEMPEPDEYVFTCLLDALCNNGSVKDAAKLFEEMRLRFKPPSRGYFTSLLCGWCREGKMMEAEHVLVQMKEAGFEPDVVDYTNLISGYALAGKMADGYDVLRDMRRRGFEPNGSCYTVLIQALCKVDRMEEAMRVFEEMERYECEADTVTYTELVSGFCNSGKIDKCYGLLDDMIKRGLTPSQLTYMHIMSAHEKRENFEECLELMEKMKQIGFHLDLDVYNVVIRLACKLGEVKEAVRLWNEMEAGGLRPEVDTFVVMINGLTSQGCLLEACGHFKEMVSRGLFSVPQYVTLKSLLNSVLRNEKLEMAEDVWSCVTSKGASEVNVSSWTIWIHALFSRGYVKEACSYSVEMIEMDFMPKPDTFAKLMKGVKKLYNREFAVEITEKVRNMAAERGLSFKMYKRRGVDDLTEKAKARKDREGKKKKKRRTP